MKAAISSVHECGAPEFFTHGAKLIGLAGDDGKLTAGAIAAALGRCRAACPCGPAFRVSLSQASELGTVYSWKNDTQSRELAHAAKASSSHLDGARFANAMAALDGDARGSDLAMRRRCSVLRRQQGRRAGGRGGDFFRPGQAADFEYRRKKSGHLISKMRFVSAQLGSLCRKRPVAGKRRPRQRGWQAGWAKACKAWPASGWWRRSKPIWCSRK